LVGKYILPMLVGGGGEKDAKGPVGRINAKTMGDKIVELMHVGAGQNEEIVENATPFLRILPSRSMVNKTTVSAVKLAPCHAVPSNAEQVTMLSTWIPQMSCVTTELFAWNGSNCS
jgi:hypothetical protein